MAKLQISEREIALIKGLIAHKGLNDQEVLAIFSHLERNINSREIGYIRRGERERYRKTAACSKELIDTFLQDYGRLEEVAERLPIYDVPDNHLSVYKALDYARSAVANFNNNTIAARSEIFIILMVVAWTYVLHAKLREAGVEPIYRDAQGDEVLVDGQPKHWELSRCIKQGECGLSQGEVKNISFLVLIRNEIEHRSTEDINEDVQSRLQATALNFVRYVAKNFGRKFDISKDFGFAIQLQALRVGQKAQLRSAKGVSKTVEAVNALIEKDMSIADFNDPDYAFRVYVVPKVVNNEKNADQAVTYSPVGSAVEMAIKHVERPKRRMTEALTLLRNQGTANVTAHRFIRAWQDHDLKNPGKGLAIELGGQWFWYDEGIEAIRQILNG